MNKRTPDISIAPMLDWTDRHCRYFHRLLSPNVTLFTEMVTTGALIHGDRDRHLRYDPEEHPVVLQLGGSDPFDLAECARMAADYGYDEINLNCGCPSERVQKGAFGACLMAEPETVAACVDVMQKAVSLPISVKCRIGIDDCDPDPFLNRFIDVVSGAGCARFVIHARKAWLKGLSPKENREIPPLDYDLPFKIKHKNHNLDIIINGGIANVPDIKMHLCRFDGVMIGREAYQNPKILHEIERLIYCNKLIFNDFDVAEMMIPYIEKQVRDFQTPPNAVTRHMIGLFNGRRGSRHWRRVLSEDIHKEPFSAALIKRALEKLEDRVA